MSYLIKKMDGTTEPFNEEKVRNSLQLINTSPQLIDRIVKQLYISKPATSRDIYGLVYDILQKENPAIAGRYNLKQALLELGPAGFPFERYIALIFEAMEYQTSVDNMVEGICVTHEVDIIAEKENKKLIIECKYHNNSDIKTDVVVALYTQARFEDIKDQLKKNNQEIQAGLITNTKFTSEAIRYGQCKNIKLLGWSYPPKESLAYLIDKFKLYPITTIQKLSQQEKREFIQKGFLLCKDASKNKNLLSRMGYSPEEINKLIEHAQSICFL